MLNKFMAGCKTSYKETKDYKDTYNKGIEDFERIMCEELKNYIDSKEYMDVGLALYKFTRKLADDLRKE